MEVKNIAGVTSVAKGFELINGASLFMSNSRIGEKYFGNPPIGSFAFLWDVSGSASELLWMANSYVETTNGGVTIRDTSLATSTVPGKVLGNGSGAAATSLALAANGTNCSTGNGAGGVDASGNAEDCTDYVGVAGAETITGAKTFGAGLSVSDGQTINLLGTTPKIEFANNMTMMRTGGATVVAYSGDGGSFNGEARYLNGNGLHGLSIVATAANVQINKQEAGNLFLNGSSIDVDTIVRGDTDANLLTVNAGEDAVNVGQATAGGTAGAKLTVNGVLHLVPIGTAPTNCSIGDFYSDTSGASCACTSTDTWTNMHGVGSCA
ncbi:MAG: hypothetical protein HKO76_04935 [Acidimicrobiia bacterium]|nr:hypothetical protein [Acidimicrobiia bacterium]